MEQGSFNLNSNEELIFFIDSVKKLVLPLVNHNGCLVGLEGHLGAGKTYFINNFLKQVYSFSSVSSPTYNIENIYHVSKDTIIRHLDIYRLNSITEEINILPRKGELVFVEWINKWSDFYKNLDLLLKFTVDIDMVYNAIYKVETVQL
jgi:tRNA threonylcarbamoyl adenosine modification protein YjeE